MTRILVTGATGTVGSHLVRELRGRGGQVRAFVRDGDRAEIVLGDDIEYAVGDFADTPSVERALDGVDAVYLACGNRAEQVDYECRVVDLAAAAGVTHVVKLSALGAAIGSPVAFWHWHGLIEQHLVASGVPATMLRPAFSMANLLGSAGQVAEQGALFLPAKDARVSMVDPRDVAAAAAAALTAPAAHGGVHVLTGPEALTFERVAQELSVVVARPVQFVPVPDAAARDGLLASGIPEFVADQIVTVFGQLRDGLQQTPTDGVQSLTGAPPRPLADFLRSYAAAFRPVAGVR